MTSIGILYNIYLCNRNSGGGTEVAWGKLRHAVPTVASNTSGGHLVEYF